MLRQTGPSEHQADGRGLVVFLSGTWMKPDAWTMWRELFDINGYDSVVGPDTGTGSGRSPSAPGVRLDRVVHDAAAVLAGAQRPPILIGHGIGALVVQLLLACSDRTAAAIAIAPAPACWVSRTAVVTLAHSRAALGARPWTSTGLLRPAAFARAYASTIGVSEATALYHRYVIAGAAAPLLTASLSWRDPNRSMSGRRRPGHPAFRRRPPLLVLSGGKDRLCPERTAVHWTRFGRRHFPDDVTDHHVFVDRGHSLTIDNGWPEVANFCLDWLTSHDL